MTEAPPPSEPFARRARSSLEEALVVAALLFVLVSVGLALTTAQSSWAFGYWAFLVPVFGAAALWGQLRGEGEPQVGRHLLRGALHWLGALVALALVFRLLHWGQVDGRGAGLLAILVLTLSCFTAGLQGAPALLGVAGLLTVGLVVAIEITAYLPLVVGLGALAALGAAFWWWRSRS